MMKQVCILLLLCSVLLVSSQPLTASMPSVWDKRVSFEFKDTPFKEAVDTLFREAGLNYAFAGTFSEVKVTTVIHDIDLGSAFWYILNAGGATADVEKATVLIRPKRSADRVVSELQHKLVESKVQLAVELRNKKEEDADVQNLRAAIKALEEQFAKEYELAVWEETVNVDMKDMPLDSALGQLLRGTEINYMVDRDVAALKVAAVLKNVTRETAFREILKASGVVANVSPDGIWRISSAGAWYPWAESADLQLKLSELKQKLQSGPVKPPDDKDVLALKAAIAELESKLAEENKRAGETMRPAPRTVTEGGRAQASRTQVFVIKYINPADLPPLIYALGAQQVTVVTGGKLVVRASDTILQDAAEIIKELDSEDALPRPVTLKLTIRVTTADASGKEEIYSVTASDQGPEGSMLEPNIRSNDFVLDGYVWPSTASKGIALSGKGHLIMTRPNVGTWFNIATTLETGKPGVVAFGSTDTPSGRAVYTVEAVAEYGVGRVRDPLRLRSGTGNTRANPTQPTEGKGTTPTTAPTPSTPQAGNKSN